MTTGASFLTNTPPMFQPIPTTTVCPNRQWVSSQVTSSHIPNAAPLPFTEDIPVLPQPPMCLSTSTSINPGTIITASERNAAHKEVNVDNEYTVENTAKRLAKLGKKIRHDDIEEIKTMMTSDPVEFDDSKKYKPDESDGFHENLKTTAFTNYPDVTINNSLTSDSSSSDSDSPSSSNSETKSSSNNTNCSSHKNWSTPGQLFKRVFCRVCTG